MQKPKRILILGPESTGKSTLAAALAAYFQEPWVPEVAREYLEKLDRPYAYEDLLQIGKQQMLLEDELAGRAKNYLFCDTDLRVLKLSATAVACLWRCSTACWRSTPRCRTCRVPASCTGLTRTPAA